MKIKIAIYSLLILFLIVNFTTSLAISDSFDHLSILKIKDKNFKNGIRVNYNPKITEVINKKEKSDIFIETGIYDRILIKTKINKNENKFYTIKYHPGMSADPVFVIYENSNGSLKWIGGITGLAITFPGNGFIYVEGHTNNMFDQKKKFRLINDKIVEVVQPFYYVGLETEIIQDVKIFSDINESKEVAFLPKGAKITVLINKGDHFLIKTPFGLTGWIKIKRALGGPIKGLFY